MNTQTNNKHFVNSNWRINEYFKNTRRINDESTNILPLSSSLPISACKPVLDKIKSKKSIFYLPFTLACHVSLCCVLMNVMINTFLPQDTHFVSSIAGDKYIYDVTSSEDNRISMKVWIIYVHFVELASSANLFNSPRVFKVRWAPSARKQKQHVNRTRKTKKIEWNERKHLRFAETWRSVETRRGAESIHVNEP